MLGNAYLKGTIYATDGVFSGELKAASGTFSGELKAATGNFSGTVTASKFVGKMDMNEGELIGPAIYVPSKEAPNFKVDSNGNVTINKGDISFGALDQNTQNTIDSKVDADDVNTMIGNAVDGLVPEYIKSTYIDFSQVATPTLIANYVRTLGQFQVGYGSRTSFDSVGYIGTATGSTSLFGGADRVTYGIAMSTTNRTINASTVGNYVIVTDSGVRMTYNDGNSKHSLYVDSGGAWVDDGIERQAIGTGKAVFG